MAPAKVADMSILVPHHALIVVADGVHAKFFRNSSHDGKPVLSSDGELKPTIS